MISVGLMADFHAHSEDSLIRWTPRNLHDQLPHCVVDIQTHFSAERCSPYIRDSEPSCLDEITFSEDISQTSFAGKQAKLNQILYEC